MSFVHLHVHTKYSVFDGMSSPEKLFGLAESIGMPGLAVTDHGTMYGIPDFLNAAKKHPGVKPIVGCEVYVTEHDHRVRSREHRHRAHLILLAKNLTGYRNLMKIVSEENTKGQGRRPVVSYDYIFAHAEGLIATSACIGGDIPKAILDGNMSKAALLAMKMQKVFGDDFYLEISEHESRKEEYDGDLLEKQRKVTEGLYRIASQLGIKVVATNDVHFAAADDDEAHDVLLCANTGHTMDDPERFIYTGQEYLKSEEEMRAVFPDHPDAIDNTVEILDKIERFEIGTAPSVPDFPLPKPYGSPFEYLRDLAVSGLEERGLDSVEAKARLQRELEEIRKMDIELGGAYSNHLLILWDLLCAMRERGVEVGPGRGSAAGSLLNYALHITDVNPLEHGLLFERFINVSRAQGVVPDIDVDFGEDGIKTAYRYLQDRYGYLHVSRVVCFGTRAVKTAVKVSFKAYGLGLEETEAAIGCLPDSASMFESLSLYLNGHDPEGGRLRAWFKVASDMERKALMAADRIRGTIASKGVHACATLLSREPLTEHVPLEADSLLPVYSGELLSQYDCRYVEETGPERMDLLELTTLDLIRDVERCHEVQYTMDDPETLELFGNGETKGVFQFESSGLADFMKKLHPDSFSDLVMMNSVYRPGPMDWIPELINRKHSGLLAVSIPGTEEILAETYGMIVYQEQLMSIVKKVAGFSPEQADRLRKAFGKRKKDVVSELRVQFIEGGVQKGYDRDALEEFFDKAEEEGPYCFNKSHAVCYTLLAYKCAYLKSHYPADFFASALANTHWDRQKLVDDAPVHGIEVTHPDVNRSLVKALAIDDGTVMLGLSDIRSVTETLATRILSEREEGAFTDLKDFALRCDFIPMSVMEYLAGSGALDSLGVERGRYFSGEPYWKEVARCMAEVEPFDSDDIFHREESVQAVSSAFPDPPEASDVDDTTLEEIQIRSIGLYLGR